MRLNLVVSAKILKNTHNKHYCFCKLIGSVSDVKRNETWHEMYEIVMNIIDIYKSKNIKTVFWSHISACYKHVWKIVIVAHILYMIYTNFSPRILFFSFVIVPGDIILIKKVVQSTTNLNNLPYGQQNGNQKS